MNLSGMLFICFGSYIYLYIYIINIWITCIFITTVNDSIRVHIVFFYTESKTSIAMPTYI